MRRAPRKTMASRLMDLASLLRPWLLLPSMFSLLAGALLAARTTSQVVPPGKTLLAVVLAGPLLAGSCMVYNQVASLSADSKDPRKRNLPLVRGRVSLRAAHAIFLVLLGLSLLVATVLAPMILAVSALTLVLCLSYSHPLARVRERPPWDCIASVLSHGTMPMVVGWSLVTGFSFRLLAMVVPPFLLLASGYLLLGLPDLDLEADLQVRKLTVVLGYRRTILLSVGLLALSAMSCFSLAVAGWYAPSSVIVLPVLVSIGAVHWRLVQREGPGQVFDQLRYLYIALGAIFLLSLAV